MRIEDLHYDVPTEPVDEANWNWETWRKEHPMDYFFAAYILNTAASSVEKAIAFQTIYRIVRLYIPPMLYKYCSLQKDENENEKRFVTLENKKVFLSTIEDFNDPYDSRGFFYNPEQLKDIPRLKHCRGRLIDNFPSFIRATSFTENGVQSMPMWAHYGANHRGFCVEYDMKDNLELGSCMFPIQYTDERLDITSFMYSQAQMMSEEIARQSAAGSKEIIIDDLSQILMPLLLYNLKHTSWSYEKEYRCAAAANAKGMPFIDAKPNAIYIGKDCATTHVERLIGIADSLEVPAYRMCFDEYSSAYNLAVEKCGKY